MLTYRKTANGTPQDLIRIDRYETVTVLVKAGNGPIYWGGENLDINNGFLLGAGETVAHALGGDDLAVRVMSTDGSDVLVYVCETGWGA